MRASFRRLRRHPLTRTAFGLYAVQSAAVLVPLVTLPYLARVLGSSAIGLVLVAQAYASLLTTFLEFGFEYSISREVARLRDSHPDLSARVSGVVGAKVVLMAISAAITVVVGLAIPLFRENPEYLALAWLLGVAQGSTALWYFLGKEKVAVPAALDLTQKMVAVVGILVFVQHSGDGALVLAIQAGMATLGMLVGFVFIYRRTPFARPRLAAALQTLRAAFHLALYRSAGAVHQTVPSLLVGGLSTHLQVGYYGVADKVNKAPIAALWPLSQAIYARVNFLLGRDAAHAARVIGATLALFLALGLGAGLVLALAAPYLIPLVLGSGYDEAVPVLRVLAFAVPIALLIHALSYTLLMPLGRDRSLNLMSWTAVAAMVVAGVALVPPFGAVGMAWAMLIDAGVYAALLGTFLVRLRPSLSTLQAAGHAPPDPVVAMSAPSGSGANGRPAAEAPAPSHDGRPARAPALLVIGPEPPPYTGMEVSTAALVAELRRASIPVARVNTADPEDQLGNRGKWSAHNIAQNTRHLAKTARLCFRRDVKAVYVPIAQETPAFYRDAAFILFARLARKPVLVHLQGGVFDNFYRRSGRFARRLVEATVGKAALGIVLSETLRPTLECVLPPDRVVSVANGADLEPGAGAVEARADGNGRVNVLFLSSLFVEKGLLLFVEAVALARRRRPDLRATVAGSWANDETRDQITTRLRELELEDACRFTGLVVGPDKAALLASSDIFCFPSLLREGQPYAVIEAMAAGLPVIALPNGGVVDLVAHGRTGLLVQPPSAEALADQIVHLVDRPEVRRALGEEARREYHRSFTQRAFGERALAVIRPFLARD